MPSSHTRDASRDRELVLRHQSIPISDPERAPPPLPLNPGSTSPATKGNVSPGIQAVAANFAEKMRENAPSPYTTNAMPPKSPEKSLIKGQFHKRMQSLQNADTRSEFLNYLENRSPERPLRASIMEGPARPEEKSPTKSSSATDRELERDPPNLLISNRYLSKPILGESTPPSATMLALQTMQLPEEGDSPLRNSDSDPFSTPKRPSGHSLETLSTQIISLTDIASNLQREMAQLSRRSKDNATDLISLKQATNARDEDIRKSLRELSTSLATKMLDPEAATRWDLSSLLGSELGINNRESDSSPSSRKSFSAPRMPSPNPFAAAMERELCASPTPISDGSASIALLEKVLREMATKEGQEKLLDLVDEIKSRPTSENTDKQTDSTITKMLEEILGLVKEESESKALVRARAVPNPNRDTPQRGSSFDVSLSRSPDPEPVYAPDMEMVQSESGPIAERPKPADNAVADEMLSIMKRVKNSVIEGGGMTNEVKALVRELRGEVLGMGRNLARQLEEVEKARSTEDDEPTPPSKEEISGIVESSLQELKNQMAFIMNEHRQHASALSEFRSALDTTEIYSIVKRVVEEHSMSQPPQQPGLEKDEILETVREAWETYKPEIELQNFGLERDEILECLTEGLKAYQPQHEEAVTYDQVLAAVQAGIQSFGQPPTITKDEVAQTVRECLEEHAQQTADRSLNHEQLYAIRDEILQAVTESVATQSTLTRESLDSGLGRDEILSALSEGLEAHFDTAKKIEPAHITREDVANAINDAFAAHDSAVSKNVEPDVSREEILAAIAEGLENQNSMIREIELNKEDLMEAISAGLQEALSTVNLNTGEQALERFQDLLQEMKQNVQERSANGEKETVQMLEAIKDGLGAVRQDVEGFVATAVEASGKHEIMDTVKEGFRLLHADIEKTITDAALTNSQRGNPDTPELLDAMEKEFEHLRSTLSSLLIRNNVTDDKDEILDAIRDLSEGQKSTDTSNITKVIKEEFESVRDAMTMSLVPVQPKPEKDEIVAALRESIEAFREGSNQHKDSGDNVSFSTGEVIEVLNDGVTSIRGDLAKLLERPVEIDHSELLDTLKEGLSSLKSDVEMLRHPQDTARDMDTADTAIGGELMLANEPNISGDIEALKALISQLQVKVEAIEAAPRIPEPSEDALKKEHLDEVIAGLHELQSSVAGIVARDLPADDTIVKKEHTDAIETLLRNTQSQLDELKFPAADEIAKAEQLGSLEIIVHETKEAIADLSARLEAEGPTKSEIGTLETLLKDMYIALDELKSKDSDGETDTEKLVKSDLQTVEAMIFDVKSQLEQLKLPDVETLPTKTEIQDLSILITEFRDKVEAENDLTAQGFDARKTEHAGLAEKIDEARAVVEGLGDELKSKLDGSSEGLAELKQLLEGLAASAETFSTVESIHELTELINREFERVRGEQDASKLEMEERDATALVKHDQSRAAIIVELGAKIDEKLGEVMAKYDEVHSAMGTKFSETEERDNAHLEALTDTKALAEDIKLVIGAMGDSVNETCERISVDTKAFFEKVGESYSKIEEMHHEAKTHQEQTRSDFERAVAATDRVESKLHEFHPQVLESIQEILAIVGKHYDHSQQATKDIKMDLSILPSTIPSMFPALPPPEPEKYDDTQVRQKLDNLLEHAKNEKVKEALDILVERVTNNQVHEKLDELLTQTTSTNAQVYDKLSELLDHATNTNGPIHEKLDTLLDHATNTDQSVTQMMKLDEMHKDIMETSRKMNEMFAAQTALVAEDTERRRREAEEAAIALERRNAQKEQVESEIITLKEEKDSLLAMFHTLKSEKEDLVKQNTKLSKELSSLEMALELRHEEMQVMEDRAESLEKRILEGVLDHARSVLINRPRGLQSLNMKKARGGRSRGPSTTSNASTARDARSIVGSSVGMALKKRAPASSQAGSGSPSTTSKERRILSLSNVTGNRGVPDRRASASSGFTNLKRSHSVKSNSSLRKASWGGRSSMANKENETFPEEDENQSGDESDTGTERRTSYTGTYADSMVYGTGSVVSADDRRVSAASSTNLSTAGSRSPADDHEAIGEQHDDDLSESSDDAQTTKGNESEDDQLTENAVDLESTKMVLYGQHSDSGIGTEIASTVG
ncbi:uncharacterized protein ACLA_028390 [Aspergillus clavatus NRRL 1]|uniref:Chromosome segregation ATPase family protein n=1 Tax=Aspergillus clavatus (strain ATCC 1007 / CBS 513.65 / DSM 816 / NCTC 3887 / NRRL 1 / QM 1276 / 107) TaxID=344612 RepID=A1CR43_ASPCL|nr:uncharacterized protein ACLA_028390 [Aspergillus clavatus NRRL 1]EAW08114.1 conserved hypothetical protein [Aspergillus clavatus NRRL 1]